MLRIPKRIVTELVSLQKVAGSTCVLEYCGRLAMNLPAIVKAGNLSAADQGMAGRRRRFKVCGRSITLDGAHFSGARELYARQVYFGLPGFQIQPSDVVVDLGANAGLFTVLAATIAKKVVAVEAQSGFLQSISGNVKQNGCEDVVEVVFGLIGAGTGVFSDAARLASSSHFSVPPPALSMQQIIDRYDLEVINFLKIDVEGSEFDLLTNDNEWLRRVEKIAMEVHAEFGSVSDLVLTLRKRGFAVSFLDNDQRIVTGSPNSNGYLFATRAIGR